MSRTGPEPETYYPDYEGSLAKCWWAPGIIREPDVVDYLRKARVISDDARREAQDKTDGTSKQVPVGHIHDNEHVRFLSTF